MVRLAGSILILAAGCGIGISFRRELDGHLALLYEIRHFFEKLDQRARGTLLPMEHILRETGRGTALEKICLEMAEQLEEKGGKNGAQVWKAVFLAEGKHLGLTGEELKLVAEAGDAFFGRTVEENQKNLALYLERLAFILETMREEQREKRRVYQTISVLGGVMLVILLI